MDIYLFEFEKVEDIHGFEILICSGIFSYIKLYNSDIFIGLLTF